MRGRRVSWKERDEAAYQAAYEAWSSALDAGGLYSAMRRQVMEKVRGTLVDVFGTVVSDPVRVSAGEWLVLVATENGAVWEKNALGLTVVPNERSE